MRRLMASRRAALGYCRADDRLPVGDKPLFLREPGLWENWVCRNGLMPMLYRNLERARHLDAASEELRMRMEHAFLDSAFQRERALNTVARVDEAARRAGIAFLLMKGLAFSERFYADPAARPMHDVDILVREKDRGAMVAALQDLPFEMDRPESDYASESDMTQRLMNPREPDLARVEVHWNLVNSAALRSNLLFREDDLFASAEPLRLGGLEVRIPGPLDTCAQSCIHAAQQHQFERIIWLVDSWHALRYAGCDGLMRTLAQRNSGSPGALAAIHAVLRMLKGLFPDTGLPDCAEVGPRGWLTRRCLGLLTPECLLRPEGSAVKWRRKAFREALKWHARTAPRTSGSEA